MKMCFRYIILLLLLSVYSNSYSQNLTGCWEGIMGDEFFQLNIEQQNNELCGYTYDTVLNKPNDYCKARFFGKYNNDSGVAVISGNQFLANTGGHILMTIILKRKSGDRKDILHVSVSSQGFLGSLFGQVEEDFVIRKVSNRPLRSYRMPDCFPKPPKRKAAVTPKKTDLIKPIVPVSPQSKPNVDIPKIIKPSEQKSITKTDPNLLNKVNLRKQLEQGRITVTTDKINLKLYDNGVVDNDTVSVFYNGKLLVSHQRLSETPIEIALTLDANVQRHELTLFAENLGGIPPNTALIIVTVGKQRYELHSKASLDENAVLIFDYKKE